MKKAKAEGLKRIFYNAFHYYKGVRKKLEIVRPWKAV